MKKKNFKGRVEKRFVTKCEEVCRTYSPIQSAYVDVIENERDDIVTFQCNVPWFDEQEVEYTTDFVCKKQDGSLLVLECIERKLLGRPHTIKLLQSSYTHWSKYAEWGLVVDAITEE